MPTTLQERRHRYTALALLVLVITVPLVLFFATLPGDGTDGFIDISGTDWRIILPVVTGVIFVILGVLLGTCASIRADHELLFGAMTVFMVLTTAAVFASAFARKHVENDAALTFVLAALTIATLILVAHDWARRQLMIAAVVAAAALGLFFVRIGYESLSVPPRWERAQIAQQAKAQEIALEAQHAAARPGLLAAARTARTTLSAILGGATPPNVDHALLGQARIILYDANTSLTTIGPQAFVRFDVLMANEAVAFPPAATAELADAVHALRAAEVAAARQIDQSALDQAICAVTGHRIRPSTGTCATGGPDKIRSSHAWVAAKHDLDVELATYRAAVTGTAADEAALRKVLAQPASTDADVTVLAAIENGPETLWGSVFQAAVPPLAPGPLGWVILGALLLGLLRWLLMVNASQLAGPVEIVSGKNDDERLVAVLRVAVLQNVAEPGVAPGAPSASPVTTLLSIAGASLGPVTKIVQAALTVVGRRYGYQVSMDVTREAAATSGTAPGPEARTGTADTATAASSAGITTVLVRVTSISGGVTLASRVFTDPDDVAAVRAAGLWAAGDILNRSSRIPGWAEWNADTASARVLANAGTRCTIPELKSALQEAPNSGLLLARLGHCYELAGLRTDAVGYYARAVATHPHYWVARYRLAAALGAMRHDARVWVRKHNPERRDDLRAVKVAIEALQVHIDGQLRQLETITSAEDARDAFKSVALTLFRALDLDTRYPQRVLGALRRSERDLTWPTLVPRSTSAGRRFHPLVKSALRSLGDAGQLGKLRDSAGRPQSWWQISYNAACGYASSITPLLARDADQALCLLEQTLAQPGIHQLSAEWVTADAALSSLAASPRFTRFVAQLRPGD
jgi:hypothetical protein